MKLSPIRAVLALLAILAGITVVDGPTAARADASPIESGAILLGTSWRTVQLGRHFEDPVVVAGTATVNDPRPAVAQVRNVKPSSFELRLRSWAGDGSHGDEVVPFMVMEAGKNIVGGRIWYAGHEDGVGTSWSKVGVRGYHGNQTVLATVVTAGHDRTTAARISDVDAQSFRVRLDGAAGAQRERIAYVISPCCSGADGGTYYAGVRTTDSTAWLPTTSIRQPLLFATVSSTNDARPATVRNVDTSADSVTLGLEGSESEEVRFVVIDGATTTGTVAVIPTTSTTTTTTTTTTTVPPTTTTTTTTPPTTTTTTTPPTTTTTTTVPPRVDNSCYRPRNAVRVEVGQNLNRIANQHATGTTFLLAAGIHQQAEIRPKYGQTFVGERGPNCERLTTLNGAQRVTDWTRQDGMWKSTGHAKAVKNRPVPCEPGHPRCMYPQDLYMDGTPLLHVASRNDVGPGSWFFDYAGQTIWTGDNPAGHRLELSVSEAAFHASADRVRISGLRMEQYANASQYGVIGRHGTEDDWVIDDNFIGISHAVGAVLGPRATFVDNHVTQQGGLGVKIIGSGTVATGNTIVDNGWGGQKSGWEGGGFKVSTRTAHVNDNCVAGNRGVGLWADEAARRVTFDGNIVFDNYAQGIFYEISELGTITNNRVGHNGHNARWLYGAQIMISTSSDTQIVGNDVVVNGSHGNGITMIWQKRHNGEAVRNEIRDNDITFLSNQGVNGMRHDFPGGARIYRENTFTGNRYHVTDKGTKRFVGENGSMTFAQAQATGLERGSTIDTNARDLSWGCPAP